MPIDQLTSQQNEAVADASPLLEHEQPESPPGQEGDAFSPSWDNIRFAIQELAMSRGHWHGYPLPDDECELVVHPRFPVQSMQGAKLRDDDDQPPGMDDATFARLMAAAFDFKCGKSKLVNQWHDRRRQRFVLVFERPDGKRFVRTMEAGPGQRADLLLATIGVSRCWDWEGEITALKKLLDLLPRHLFMYYSFTGTFLERSPRSNVLYVFRRCRPTLAFSNYGDRAKCLTALCMHPIGYYSGSFGGAMVPTDDVIAHLLLMRGDEHHFWKCCNQHSVWLPEAGL